MSYWTIISAMRSYFHNVLFLVHVLAIVFAAGISRYRGPSFCGLLDSCVQPFSFKLAATTPLVRCFARVENCINEIMTYFE